MREWIVGPGDVDDDDDDDDDHDHDHDDDDSRGRPPSGSPRWQVRDGTSRHTPGQVGRDRCVSGLLVLVMLMMMMMMVKMMMVMMMMMMMIAEVVSVWLATVAGP